MEQFVIQHYGDIYVFRVVDNLIIVGMVMLSQEHMILNDEIEPPNVIHSPFEVGYRPNGELILVPLNDGLSTTVMSVNANRLNLSMKSNQPHGGFEASEKIKRRYAIEVAPNLSQLSDSQWSSLQKTARSNNTLH